MFLVMPKVALARNGFTVGPDKKLYCELCDHVTLTSASNWRKHLATKHRSELTTYDLRELKHAILIFIAVLSVPKTSRTCYLKGIDINNTTHALPIKTMISTLCFSLLFSS